MKSEKTKQRLQKRKEEKQHLEACAKLAKSASIIKNPLVDYLPAFQSYKLSDGQRVKIEFLSSDDLNTPDKEAVFSLLETNMRIYYQKSDWGWKEKEKREELFHYTSKFLIVRSDETENDSLLAFANFRFDVEDMHPVLYCYEVQVKRTMRGKGIGKFLVNILLLLANKTHMEKVMITAFKQNEQAVKFFNKLKFDLDETDPLKCDGDNTVCYWIMSRPSGCQT